MGNSQPGPSQAARQSLRSGPEGLRKLVLISKDLYLRQFLESGAFAEIDGPELYLAASASDVVHEESLRELSSRPSYLGEVEHSLSQREYHFLHNVLLAGMRSRSRTMRAKFDLYGRTERIVYAIAALRPIRRLLVAWARRRSRNRRLESLVRELDPAIVIVPTGGHDPFAWEGIAAARRAGVPTLALTHNWDNLSSKGAFPEQPDHLGVWGEQSAEHARRIHGFPAERIVVLGAPSLDPYFRRRPGSTNSPFDFPYVLFAGCYAPFDERRALGMLDRVVAARGLELKVVYRPHPHRAPRAVPDRVDEEELPNVVIDPQVCAQYLRSFETEYGPGASRAKPLFPALDYYPALLEHARFVVCPLSTMIVEAAIFERRVLVVAYDDGVHPNPPSEVIGFDHFQGLEDVTGFEICRRAEHLPEMFARLAANPQPPGPALRDQIGWWLYHDELTYGRRLARLVARLAAGGGGGGW